MQMLKLCTILICYMVALFMCNDKAGVLKMAIIFG